MDVVDLQSWAAFAAILGALLANFAMTSRKFDRLESKIDGVESRLDTKIDGSIASLRQEMQHGFDRFDNRMNSIDERLFDVSSRLPAAPAAKHG